MLQSSVNHVVTLYQAVWLRRRQSLGTRHLLALVAQTWKAVAVHVAVA